MMRTKWYIKLIYVLMPLVLALSLSLLTAAPVAAQSTLTWQLRVVMKPVTAVREILG